jgi:hypothetical protein
MQPEDIIIFTIAIAEPHHKPAESSPRIHIVTQIPI